jgi:hypothetical protein
MLGQHKVEPNYEKLTHPDVRLEFSVWQRLRIAWRAMSKAQKRAVVSVLLVVFAEGVATGVTLCHMFQ